MRLDRRKPPESPLATLMHIFNQPVYLNKQGHVDFKPGDARDPLNWSSLRRWYITLCTVLLVLNGNLAASITSGCLPSLSEDFSVSEVAASLTITLYVLGYCAGPFIWAPVSEFFGRSRIFYVTFFVFQAFNLLCAFSPNFGALLVGRFLAGTFISATLSNAPAMLADLWDPIDRGNAMAIFSFIMWMGPSLGPIVGGYVQLRLDSWRWVFYIILAFGAATVPFLFSIPETHASTILRKMAKKARESGNPEYEHAQADADVDRPTLTEIYKVAFTRPWYLFADLVSLVCAIYLGVVFMLQYMLFSIYPIVFQDMRGWDAGAGQLPLIGTIAGAVPGTILIFMDTRRRRKLVEKNVRLEPEDRLLLAAVGGVGFPVAMFWLAWTAQYNAAPWAIPAVAGGFLSMSLMLIFVAYLNYIVDSYLHFAASAVAANTFARLLGSASAPLFTRAMFETLGVGGGGSLIGGVAALLAVVPFVFLKYGKQIRVKSKYAPTDDEERDERNEETGPMEYGVAQWEEWEEEHEEKERKKSLEEHDKAAREAEEGEASGLGN
ncbi:putative MFS multidrug transporter [Sodiomyces alkalinus F11]|uniref:Putative MFS multidrug transporter n=1 Tax=Sodiomyces alkalinus (strain CBS 110278 / VKM F-3762 / F11) TaxID=1314773 RepID=A0A3N2QAJ6_SODAK|nr:putative MFS multidrug transporter [Sodiomyces alkalinus F11]ROT43782.1 putative MFS multidrug transporter [Sodiomyces alkalinus F11]